MIFNAEARRREKRRESGRDAVSFVNDVSDFFNAEAQRTQRVDVCYQDESQAAAGKNVNCHSLRFSLRFSAPLR